jgi:hypothetical protein
LTVRRPRRHREEACRRRRRALVLFPWASTECRHRRRRTVGSSEALAG